jgi:hypothetical protein
MFLAGYINLTLQKEYEMGNKLEFDFDPEPASDSWDTPYRMVEPRVQDITPELKDHLDNDGQMLMDRACLVSSNWMPGNLAVVKDSGYKSLDGKVVLIVGVRTRYEVEGG